MKSISFKGNNAKFSNSHTGKTIYSHAIPGKTRIHLTCWRMDLLERIKVLFTGKIWAVSTGEREKIHPIQLTTNRKKYFK